MNDIDLTISIFAVIDDIIKSIKIDSKPGPNGKLSESEILTLMIIHPILIAFCDLKRYNRWIEHNFKNLFPTIPEYSRVTWIENIFGFLKTKLGLDKIRVRKMSFFLARIYALLCCYNLKLDLNLSIWQFSLIIINILKSSSYPFREFTFRMS